MPMCIPEWAISKSQRYGQYLKKLIFNVFEIVGVPNGSANLTYYQYYVLNFKGGKVKQFVLVLCISETFLEMAQHLR